MACATALILAAAGCGGDEAQRTIEATTPTVATSPVTVPKAPARPSGSLDVGLTETNPHLLWSRKAVPDAPDVFGPWRDRVEELAPRYYRLFVDWQALQPDPSKPPNFGIPGDGCMRGLSPCAPFKGIREILEAARSQQEAGHGFKTLIVPYGVPEWAARKPGGCERDGTIARSRPITDQGLQAYRALVRSLLALGKDAGIDLPYWSPWNEPNHPSFVSPQRERCDVHAPSLAPGVYTRLARAMRDELKAAGGTHQLVLGEMAGAKQATPRGSSITEFVRALPDDVACASKIWSQHQYARPGVSAATGPVEELERALARRPCTRDAHIWVTETGVVGRDAGVRRDRSPQGLQRSCVAMERYLRRWYLDPKVDVAFQYTFRDDPAYPVGFADNRLTRAYPVYALWRRLSRDREPPAEADCRASTAAQSG